MNSRLLYVVGQLRDGGSERQLYYLLKTMDRTLYYPQVIVWNYRAHDKYVSKCRELDVPLHGFEGPGMLPLRAGKLKALRTLVRRIKPEVVHSYSFYTNFAVWYAAVGTDTVAIGSVRSEFDGAKKESGVMLGNLSARWPRHQIFNNSAAAQRAQEISSPFAPSDSFVVRNGVDLEIFKTTDIPDGVETRLIGIGTLVAVKRWDRLLTAMCHLKRKGVDCSLRIIGDGPLRTSLEKQAEDLRIDKAVEFSGRTDKVTSALADATILAHSADSEGCPNVIMEAMACGRPVVATDAGDVSSLVDEGRTGFVVRRGDDEALVARLATLASDRDLCRRMGQAARAKAEKEFGLERLVNETLATYRAAGWND